METKLGWVLTGTLPLANSTSVISLLTVTDHDVDLAIKQFWELEAIGVHLTKEKTVSEEEAQAVELFKKHCVYEVGFLFLQAKTSRSTTADRQ